ncbi:nuclear transport factor 2 family protein [Micromonospora siamensis]|uniref:SnoaL-like domain-containing protein n=1 Tax=Micromonospora siamensis TaxID=299152 RepID=A0A1C5JSE7_9ACTN|nr:nuclear transport factor 2 family protein [Micromonospora siamensis]SCG72946.1 SnoaL-like domain-containing protein [Micromonospora siamensis]
MTVLPGSDLGGYLRAYVAEMAFGQEEPGRVMDRYHTPDVVWLTDGVRLDRQRLIDHARPVRRTVSRCDVEVHEVLRDGDRIAARYALHAVNRGREVTSEVHMFGRLAPDGRLRRIDQLTRTTRREQRPG